MLKVLPLQSKSEQEAVCARCGIPYRPELLAYAATVDETLVGICQFTLRDEGGLLYDLAAADGMYDAEVLFVLGRATLNFIDLAGIHQAFFEGRVTDEALLARIGFRQREDGRYAIDLTHFFSAPCQHDHV